MKVDVVKAVVVAAAILAAASLSGCDHARPADVPVTTNAPSVSSSVALAQAAPTPRATKPRATTPRAATSRTSAATPRPTASVDLSAVLADLDGAGSAAAQAAKDAGAASSAADQNDNG